MAGVPLLLIVTIFVGFFYIIQRYMEKLKMFFAAQSLPGPKALPLVGNALTFIGNTDDICNKLVKLCDNYPSLYRVWLGFRLIVVMYDPEHLKVVLTNSGTADKSSDYEFMKPFTGESILTAKGSQWRIERKYLSPPFQFNSLKTFMDKFNRNANVFVQKLESQIGKEVKIYNHIITYIADTIFETAMDSEFNTQTEPDCKVYHYFERGMDIVGSRIYKFWLYPNIIFYNSPSGKEQQECVNFMNRYTDEIVKKKKTVLKATHVPKPSRDDDENEQSSKRFLDLTVELARNGDRISEKKFRDEINIVIIAGTDTTTSMISFVLLMLATFPEIQDKVYQELYEIYGSSDLLEVPIKYDDLQRMYYLERVIKETMRLFPAVPMTARKVEQDVKVNDKITLPKGSSALINIFKLHRCEKYWPEPLKFDPDRHLPENVAARHPFSFIPFSKGPKTCLGAKYVVINMKTIIATTLRKLIVTLDEPKAIEDIKLKSHIVLKTKTPIMLRFKKRH